MTINTAEKIETIVRAGSSGTFGEFVEYAPGKFRVTADNRTVLVHCGAHGWHVSFKSFEAIDPELYIAARDALDAGQGVSARRERDYTRRRNLVLDEAAAVADQFGSSGILQKVDRKGRPYGTDVADEISAAIRALIRKGD